jgi:hypothetical protein
MTSSTIKRSQINGAKIHKPARTAMQSGLGNTKRWVLEFARDDTRFIEPVMGWTGDTDTQSSQVKLYFDTLEEAEGYAKKYGISYEVIPAHTMNRKPKSYLTNFK